MATRRPPSPERLRLAGIALTQALQSLAATDDGRAFANFLVVFKLRPERVPEYRGVFSECLGRWARTLREAGREQDLLTCYHEACSVIPDSPELLNGLGSELFRLGFLDEAASYFRKSLHADPDHTPARQNLQNLCGHLVERWHFRMLNDVRRSRAYREAVRRAVSRGHRTVLDVGTGTGLLSMFAAEAGARAVYGCEMSEIMYQLACDCVALNNMKDDIKLISKKSTDIEIPADIPNKVSLLVTETFDAGLLGEHILSTMAHAWEHLLVNTPGQKAQVIPKGATLHICAIESETIRRQNRSMYPGARHLEFGSCSFASHQCSGPSAGSDPLGAPSEGPGHSGDSQSDDPGATHDDTSSHEPYTAHRLTDLPGGYRQLTEAVAATSFVFNDPKCISEYQSGVSCDHTLTLTSTGQLDALVVWFDLHLDDTVTLSSAPDQASCWEQAVYPLQPAQSSSCSSHCSLLVREGDQVDVSLSCRDNAVWLRCHQIKRQTELTDTKSTTSDDNTKAFRLSPDEISRINDLSWNQAFCQALEDLRGKSTSDLSVLSLIQDFSLLPLQTLQIGAREVCVVGESTRREILEELAETNSLDSRQVQHADTLEAVPGQWSALLVDVVDPSGCLRPQVLEDVALARMSCMPPGGVVIPQRVCVYGLLIESASLLRDSMVTTDDNTLGIKVKAVINDFQMSHHSGISLSTLDHKKLSEPFQLLTFDLDQPLDADGDLETTFLSQTRQFGVRVTAAGSLGALLYWFDLHLSPGVSYSSLGSSGHIHQAAFIQREQVEVEVGAEVDVKVVCQNSCIDVTWS